MDASEAPDENKRQARCYYCFKMAVFLVLFLDSVVSLGSFGVIQAKVSNIRPRAQSCILFGSSGPHINLSTIGICAFILWGQISVTIVVFVWLIYYSVLCCLGTKV